MTITSDSTIVVDNQGSLTGTTLVTGVELMASQLRQFTSRLEDPQAAKQLATGLLSMEGLTGTAQFSNKSDAGNAGYKAEFTINNWINVPGPGAVRLPSGLLAASPIRLLAVQTLNVPAFTVERICIPGILTESASFQLPAAISSVKLPKDVEVANAFASYRSAYTRDGNVVKVTRSLMMALPRTTCTPAESASYRELLEQVRRDTSAQMTYE